MRSVRGFHVVVSQLNREVPVQSDERSRFIPIDPQWPIEIQLINYSGLKAPVVVQLGDKVIYQGSVPANATRRILLQDLTNDVNSTELRVLFHKSTSSCWRSILQAQQPQKRSPSSSPTKSSDARLASYRNVPPALASR